MIPTTESIKYHVFQSFEVGFNEAIEGVETSVILKEPVAEFRVSPLDYENQDTMEIIRRFYWKYHKPHHITRHTVIFKNENEKEVEVDEIS